MPGENWGCCQNMSRIAERWIKMVFFPTTHFPQMQQAYTWHRSGLSSVCVCVCVWSVFLRSWYVYLWLWRRRCSKGQPAPCIFTQTSATPGFLAGCPGTLRMLPWFSVVKSCVSTDHQKVTYGDPASRFWLFFCSFTLWAPFLQLGERLANKHSLTCQQGPHLGLPESHSSQ